MTIIAQYLFGSHARRDFSAKSDIDILSITNESKFSSKNADILNISLYPKTECLKAARQGDLFLLHIILEAVCLYDSESFDRSLKEAFWHKASYQKEIQNAIDLGWFVYENAAAFADANILNKRIAWCVRTVLIAKSAERRIPIFGAEPLAAQSGFAPALFLINQKNDPSTNLNALEYFGEFLKIFGPEPSPDFLPSDWKAVWWRFAQTENKFGLRSLKELSTSNQNMSDELITY